MLQLPQEYDSVLQAVEEYTGYMARVSIRLMEYLNQRNWPQQADAAMDWASRNYFQAHFVLSGYEVRMRLFLAVVSAQNAHIKVLQDGIAQILKQLPVVEKEKDEAILLVSELQRTDPLLAETLRQMQEMAQEAKEFLQRVFPESKLWEDEPEQRLPLM